MITNVAIPFLPAAPNPMPPGRTILLLAVIPGLPTAVYNTPYIVGSTMSAVATFGPGAMVRAIGETFRQGASAVLAIATDNAANIPGVISSLNDTPFDILVPLGVLADSAHFMLYGGVANTREKLGSPIVVLMPTDTTNSTDASALIANSPALIAGRESTVGVPNPGLFSKYIVNIPDKIMINPNTPSQYQTNPCASIAGLMNRLRPTVSLSNQALQGVNLVGGYSNTDAVTLAANGITTLRNSTRRGIVVNYAVTSTSTDITSVNYSPSFHNLGTLRLCQWIVSQIKLAGQTLIGEPSTQQVQKAISDAVAALKADGSIQAVAYTIDINQLLGQVYITFDLAIPTEVQKISLNARLTYIRS